MREYGFATWFSRAPTFNLEQAGCQCITLFQLPAKQHGRDWELSVMRADAIGACGLVAFTHVSEAKRHIDSSILNRTATLIGSSAEQAAYKATERRSRTKALHDPRKMKQENMHIMKEGKWVTKRQAKSQGHSRPTWHLLRPSNTC